MTKIYIVFALLFSFIVVSYAQKELEVDVKKTMPSKNESNGSISISILNGEGPYTLLYFSENEETKELKNIMKNTIVLDRLSQGAYTIIIQDKNFARKMITIELLEGENIRR